MTGNGETVDGGDVWAAGVVEDMHGRAVAARLGVVVGGRFVPYSAACGEAARRMWGPLVAAAYRAAQ